MSVPLTSEVLKDNMALSLARAMTASNKRATELGIDLSQSLISISQFFVDEQVFWRVNYGTKNFIDQRGGDLIVEVSYPNANITSVMWGQ
jgi:hypothetical protein